jgi:hypothetical protein
MIARRSRREMILEAGLAIGVLLTWMTMTLTLRDLSLRKTTSIRLTSSSLRDTPNRLSLLEIVLKELLDYLSFMSLNLPANLTA